MSNVAPLFQVPANSNPKSMEENLFDLAKLCHVVEVKAPFALVHASPVGVGRIASELGLEVFPAKRGGEYYAVKVAATSKPAIVRNNVAPAPTAPAIGTTVRMDIKGTTYAVKETQCKRRQDLRRWEVRKLGDEIGKPYVVTFQAADGSRTACSCEGGIYHKHCKHMDALRAAYGKRTNSTATQVA